MSGTRLNYRVQVCDKTRNGVWETIAAFNIRQAATWYAQECATSNAQWASYRVTERGRVLCEVSP